MTRSLLIVLSMMAVAFLSGNAYDRVYNPPHALRAGDSMLDSVDADLRHLVMNYRVKLPSNRERSGAPSPGWGVVWNYLSPLDHCGVELSWGNTDFGAFDDIRFMSIVAYRMEGGVADTLLHKTLDRHVNLANGYNSLKVEKWEGRLYISVGDGDKFIEIGHIPFIPLATPSQAGLRASRPVELRRARLTAIPYPPPTIRDHTEESLDSLFRESADGLEGYWEYLDRNFKDNDVKLGGRYRLAVVKDGEGAYDILYISGASMRPEAWPKFRLKGKLVPSGFIDNYDLIWYDPDGYEVSRENYAIISENALLHLHFPIAEAQMRFRKIHR